MDVQPRPWTALVVDDSPQHRMIMTKLLQKYGVSRVDMAENGARGVEQALELRPDVIFLDGIMPEMDGVTALKEIRRNELQSVVVIVSSLSDQKTVMSFKEAGANFYLLKPIEINRFEAIIAKIFYLLASRQ